MTDSEKKGLDSIKDLAINTLGLTPNDSIITRFPPEPSGHLHLGHVKAMCLDFLIHSALYGENTPINCILRMDDTNPLSENIEYIDSIIDDVKWLGFEPFRITYTSDYFETLLICAFKLIKSGDAYVCSLTSEQISEYRTNKTPSPDRDRSIEDNLRLFTEMIGGIHNNDKYTLRMKGDLNSPNPNLWDLVFYRIIKNHPHPRTGNTYNVYPTYDFSHCIVDSIEGITHSFCSTEFITRRESYYWVLDKLGLRHTIIYEFARLEVDGYITSKRKLKEMINNKELSGWDDHRAITVKGLKKRGLTAELIKNIAMSNGYSKVNCIIPSHTVDAMIRDYMNEKCERRFAVVDPLKVDLNNGSSEKIHIPKVFYLPNNPHIKNDKSVRPLEMIDSIYIDRSDYKDVADKKCFALSPNGHYKGFGRLRYANYIKTSGMDNNGTVKVLEYDDVPDDIAEKIEGKKKIRGCYHWVPSNSFGCEFNMLNGETKYGYIENNIKEGECYQFERVGFFKVHSKIMDLALFREATSLTSVIKYKLYEICPLKSSYDK